jgi:hypothetical protein
VKRYLTTDLWLILLLTIVVLVIWMDVTATKELSKSIRAQSIMIRSLDESLSTLVGGWETPGGDGGWEVPTVGKKKEGR